MSGTQALLLRPEQLRLGPEERLLQLRPEGRGPGLVEPMALAGLRLGGGHHLHFKVVLVVLVVVGGHVAERLLLLSVVLLLLLLLSVVLRGRVFEELGVEITFQFVFRRKTGNQLWGRSLHKREIY
jgi:hypothetical protein